MTTKPNPTPNQTGSDALVEGYKLEQSSSSEQAGSDAIDNIIGQLLTDYTAYVHGVPIAFNVKKAEAKQAIQAEITRARISELNEIPHRLLHLPDIYRYKQNRLAALKAQTTQETD